MLCQKLPKYFSYNRNLSLLTEAFFPSSNACLMILEKEFWKMHGKAIIAHCLLMGKQAVASPTLWWDMMPTKALCPWHAQNSLKALKLSDRRLGRVKIFRYFY